MISSHPNGVLIVVWVVPGASSSQIVGEHGGALKVRTVAPAEGGKANLQVAALVAEAVGGRSGSVIGGLASRRKQVLVTGVTVDAATTRLLPGELDRNRTR